MDYFEEGIIGNSLIIKKKLEFIRKVAKSDKNVLIWGETGTGKSLTAKKIHELSNRRENPFISINCANIPDDLFEAELFGYVRGAFTGATREKFGLIEIAKNGTVFLDEIGDLNLHLQAKLLKIIEEKKLRRLGDTVMRKVFARFIFSTNKNLQDEVRFGRFRKDLFYRINVVRFYIPPLKDRKEDIIPLVEHILKRENINRNQEKKISPMAIKKLLNYDYPGNIRELENIIERACLLSEGDIIEERDIKFDYEQERSFSTQMGKISPEKLREKLEKYKWNKTRVADEVGLSRRQLYRLLNKYGMIDCVRKD